MPSAYVTDSKLPRARLDWAPSPTMIDDRIGTIGNTQGVNDKPRPSRKNSDNTVSNLPLLSATVTLSMSDAPAVPLSAAAPAAPTTAPIAVGDMAATLSIGG